jgi:Tfp pilus assembly major pilin PilA
MAESWKGPTAILGILTIVTTIGIFGYQEYYKKSDSSTIVDSSIVKIDSGKINLQEYTSKVAQFENRIHSIEKAIGLYSDSFATKSKYIKKTNSYIEFLQDYIRRPEADTTLRRRFNNNLDSARWDVARENADTLRYQMRVQNLLQLKSRTNDSLRWFKEYFQSQNK